MIRKIALVIACATAAASFAPEPASGSCVTFAASLGQHYEKAEVVFIGRAIDVTPVLAMVDDVNGKRMQTGNTKTMIFDVKTIVSYISDFITLEPGDLIFTGTPGSTRALQPGDVVEVEIEGIGTLKSPVQSAIL